MDDLEFTLEKIAAKRNLLKALRNAVDMKGAHSALKGSKGIMGVGKKADKRLAALLALMGAGGVGAGGMALAKGASMETLEKVAAKGAQNAITKFLKGFQFMPQALSGKGPGQLSPSKVLSVLRKAGIDPAKIKGNPKLQAKAKKILAQYNAGRVAPKGSYMPQALTALGLGTAGAGTAGYLAGKEAALQKLASELYAEKIAASLFEEEDDDFDLSDLL